MKIKKRYTGYILIFLSIIVCIITAFPVYWMVNISLKSEVNLFNYPPQILPYNLDFSGYVQAFRTGTIFIWIKNSLIVTLFSVILNVVSATLAAFALSRYNFKANTAFIFLIMLTEMIAPALIIAPIYILFLKVKLANSLIGLVLANTGMILAFSTWILKGFFDNIPKEIDEAAFIDGCSYFQVFRKIILPLSTSAIITIVVLTFFDVYNEYMFALTLVTSQNKWLGTVGLAANTTRMGTSWNVMLAQTALFCIAPLLFYFIFQRYIIKGLTAGALKF